MAKDQNFTDFGRDMNRRKPNPRHGTPWIGTELDRSGESLGAYPGTGSSLPQDIGADGFEVEPQSDEPRDDLTAIATDEEDVSPADAFDIADLNITPGVDGQEAALATLEPGRPSRVNRLDEDETPLDEQEYGQEMSDGIELGEMPAGSEDTTAGELGRYECPNCGFEYDVVVGTSARCPACNFEADLASIIGDESFHESFGATDLDE